MARPHYSEPLPPGTSALRLVTDPARMPQISGAYRNRDPLLLDAMDESLHWFDAPSSRQHFPIEGISHGQARDSVSVMMQLLLDSPDEVGDRTTYRQTPWHRTSNHHHDRLQETPRRCTEVHSRQYNSFGNCRATTQSEWRELRRNRRSARS